MNTSELVQPRHLNRRAAIYVRQSSPNQVITNKESQRMQYALRERASALGWQESDIQVVDSDLGRSGATTDGRQGFQELVAQIALGEVGMLLAFDATRLARNCSHWYQLLDLCGLHDCLIADRDYIIPEDLLDLLRDLGPKLPELWKARLLATSQKKALLRSLIDKVVIHRTAHDRVQVRVVWRGGAITSETVRVTVGKFDWLSGAEEIESTIVRMSKEDFNDEEIAQHLTAAGHCSPRSDRMLVRGEP